MTATPRISNLGERVDLELRQGSTFGPVRHTLRNPDGTPLNLTGCQVRGKVRRKALAADVVAEFATSLAPDRTEGWYEFGLSDETTAGITCGDKLTDPLSQYEYDLELEDSAGRVMCTLYGSLRVKAEVTR